MEACQLKRTTFPPIFLSNMDIGRVPCYRPLFTDWLIQLDLVMFWPPATKTAKNCLLA